MRAAFLHARVKVEFVDFVLAVPRNGGGILPLHAGARPRQADGERKRRPFVALAGARVESAGGEYSRLLGARLLTRLRLRATSLQI